MDRSTLSSLLLRICIPIFTHPTSGESQTNVEITNEDDWDVLLRMEEEWIENVCAQIVACKPDIVITEKGVSDLTQHYLLKVGRFRGG